MNLQHILFDADGVLQYAKQHWQPALQSVLALEDEAPAQALLADVFAAETEVLTSPTGFVEQLEARWPGGGVRASCPGHWRFFTPSRSTPR